MKRFREKDLEKCAAKTCGSIPNITLDEVGTQLKKMKTRNVCGPDQIPMEVWKLYVDECSYYILQTTNAELLKECLNHGERGSVPDRGRLCTGMWKSWRNQVEGTHHDV